MTEYPKVVTDGARQLVNLSSAVHEALLALRALRSNDAHAQNERRAAALVQAALGLALAVGAAPRAERLGSRCASCRLVIYWIRLAPTLKAQPLDELPHAAGNIHLNEDGTGAIVAGVRLDELRRAEVPLYRSHYASCPHAVWAAIGLDVLPRPIVLRCGCGNVGSHGEGGREWCSACGAEHRQP